MVLRRIPTMPILRYEMSIRALYYRDNSIFDALLLPEDISVEQVGTLILAECGELETLYADPQYFKNILRYWSESKLPAWTKIKEALWDTNYDPSLNYVKNTEHRGNDSSTSTDSVKGYNETAFVDSNKNASTGNNFYKRTVTGNIGIQSMSKLIGDEVEMRQKYDLINIIVNDFKQRFCILIY